MASTSMMSTNYRKKDLYSFSRDEFYSEDSGWSSYIEDSVASRTMEDVDVSSASEFSSIFSDAASLAKNMYADHTTLTTRSICKRRKTEATFIDHDLEDTASSPVCSSKVSDWEKLYKNFQGTSYDLNMLKYMEQLSEHDNSASCQGEGNSFNQIGEVMHSGFVGNDICYKGLKEKGLCLVPVSTLFNFW